MNVDLHEFRDPGNKLFGEGKPSKAEPILKEVIHGNPDLKEAENYLRLLNKEEK